MNRVLRWPGLSHGMPSVFGPMAIPRASGKRTNITNWKITMLVMGKSTISMTFYDHFPVRKLFVHFKG